MKKVKTDKSTVPISLTAKKQGSLNHEALFTPYKIQWKNSTPASQQPSSRTFFNTMKTDLATLKSDVERMIKKQVWRKDGEPSQKGISETNTNIKKEIQSKQDKKEEYHQAQHNTPKIPDLVQALEETIGEKQNGNYEKIEIESILSQAVGKQAKLQRMQKQNEELHKIIFQLNSQLERQIENKKVYQKQFNALLQQFKKEKKEEEKRWEKEIEKIQGRKNRELYYKLQQMVGLKTILEQKLEQSDKQKNILEQRMKQIEVYSNELVEKNCQLLKKIQNSVSEADIYELRKTNTDLRNHNQFLQQKIENLSIKMNLVGSKFKQKQIYIQQLEQNVERYVIKQKKNSQEKQETERAWKTACKDIQEEKNKLAASLQELKSKGEPRIIEKEQQIQKMRLQLVNLSQKEKNLAKQIEQLKGQNKRLLLENENMKKQNSINHQSGFQFSFRDESSIDLSKLGKQYQRQINELIEQNYRLKNQLAFQQSEKQRMEICTKRLEEQIILYEEIKAEQSSNRCQNGVQWEKIIQQISTLRKEKDSIIQQFQYKILKLQNELQQQKSHKRKVENESCIPVGNFNKLIRDQLQQNEELREKYKQASKQIQDLQLQLDTCRHKQDILKQELSLERMKSEFDQTKFNGTQYIRKSIGDLRRKYEAWDEKIQLKNRVIKAKDEFIEKVLVLKAENKQQQISNLLKQISLHKND